MKELKLYFHEVFFGKSSIARPLHDNELDILPILTTLVMMQCGPEPNNFPTTGHSSGFHRYITATKNSFYYLAEVDGGGKGSWSESIPSLNKQFY